MTRPERDGTCAGCVEEKHLRRCVRNGRTVWLCAECETPIGQLAAAAAPDTPDPKARPHKSNAARKVGWLLR